MKADDLILTVGEFVALLNQTLEFAYPVVTVTGELANFRVSKGRWVYFDLKDEEATVRFFGTVYQLPGPLEDGMLLAVQGAPRLHPQYGFSINVLSMRPTGEGSIKKAAALLEAKLTAEGLFDPARKRMLPHPPASIGLITSSESAAYRDFITVLGARWGGIDITLIDVQVQGDAAPAQIVAAIEQCNQISAPPDVLVITRGGGSAEDLRAFSTEGVTRAVAASRIPTLVAIGHEIDVSLAELAADVRASTPSNAAELLVPDRKVFLRSLKGYRDHMEQSVAKSAYDARTNIRQSRIVAAEAADRSVYEASKRLGQARALLLAYDPARALQRGYALVRKGASLSQAKRLQEGDTVQIQFADGYADAAITGVTMKQE